MPVPNDHLDVLQNLEATIVSLFRENPTMTDYVAGRAYEAAFDRYRAEQRGHPVKPHALTGLDAEAFDAVCATCEFRLGRAPDPEGDGPLPDPIPVAAIASCLQKLSRSVRLHTQRSGRQGYLQFVSHFV